MAPPKAPPPGKAPVKGKAGKGLGKKVGPFSLWVYLVAIGGGVAVWWFFLRGKGGGDAGYGGVETVTGSGYSPQDAAGAGAPSSNAAPSDQLSPDILAQLQGLTDQIGDVRGHVTELEDAAAAGGFMLNDDKTWSVNPGFTDAVIGGDDGGDPRTAVTRAGGGSKSGGVHKTGGGGGKKKTPTTASRQKRVAAALKQQRGKPGKVKVKKHAAAAAHPAAHAGAHRNTHPAPSKTTAARNRAVSTALNKQRRK